jgi:hypothetical protein
MREAGTILAVVTLRPESVGGAVPVFYAREESEREKLATYLSRILDAMVHDLENGTYILVRH